MTEPVAVVGAGGHARSVVQLLLRLGYGVSGIYDTPAVPDERILGIPVRGPIELFPEERPCVLALGENGRRRALFESLASRVLAINLVHPGACVEPTARLGTANQIFAFAYVNAEARIGSNTIVNTGAVIEHEVQVGSHCHIAVRATLLGRSIVGDECLIGAHAVIKEGVRLGDGIVVGANSFVNRDLLEPGTYVGVPAKRLR